MGYFYLVAVVQDYVWLVVRIWVVGTKNYEYEMRPHV